MSAPSIYGRWRGYLSILAGFMGGEDAAFGALTARGGAVVAAWETATVNLNTIAVYPVVMPLVAGKRFYTIAQRITFATFVGTATGNFVWQLQQNGTNLQPSGNSTVATAVLNANAAPNNFVGSVAAFLAPDMTTNVLSLSVLTPSTGISSATGRLIVAGYYA